jgi:tripartite-type tricarboxylate transporter receptor subunit TctC
MARTFLSPPRWVFLAAGLLPLALAATANAQTAYPSRPIRAVVAWPPGGAADIIARVAAQKLGEQVGQQFVVDNRPGASGAIGAGVAAKSAPDGYNVFIGGMSELVLNPQIVKVPYDTARDFAAVSPLAFGYYILVVHPSLPAKSVKGLIALAKAHPGEIKYASGGTGSNLSLVAELFKTSAGISVSHIPYKGGGPAGVAVLSGESQMMFSTVAATLPYIQGKRLMALAVTGAKRSAMLPQIPTFAESGVQGMDAGLWFVLLAPAATPREIVARLNAEVVKLGGAPDYRAQLDKVGFEPFTGTPEQCAAFMKTELDRWGKVIKAAGIKSDQ